MLATVPIAIVGLYALPVTVTREFVFQYTEPTVATAYAAHFVHFEAAHVVANVAGYALLVTLCYLLAVYAGRRRFFVTAFSAILLSFPFALSALNLAVPRDAIFYGFSGLNMAFLGLLVVLLGEYVRAVFWPEWDRRYVGGAFFASLGLVAILAVPLGTSSVVLAGGSLGIAGVYSRGLVRRKIRWRSMAREIRERTGYGDLLVVAAVTVVAYLFVGFPSNVQHVGAVLNLYVHFLGYSVGFTATYLLLRSELVDG